METQKLLEIIQKILLFKKFPEQIKIDSYLENDLGMDEFDKKILVNEINKQFQIMFERTEYQKWQKVQDIIIAIQERLI